MGLIHTGKPSIIVSGPWVAKASPEVPNGETHSPDGCWLASQALLDTEPRTTGERSDLGCVAIVGHSGTSQTKEDLLYQTLAICPHCVLVISKHWNT